METGWRQTCNVVTCACESVCRLVKSASRVSSLDTLSFYFYFIVLRYAARHRHADLRVMRSRVCKRAYCVVRS